MPHMKAKLPTIGEQARFYGYITGVGVERCPEPSQEPVSQNLYATFEYNGDTSVWLVPDHDLFRQLCSHLADTAVMRKEHGDYGNAKLWIGKQDDRWEVDLP
jgi:hypothetical protein